MRRLWSVVLGAGLLAGLSAVSEAPFRAFLAFANHQCGHNSVFIFEGSVPSATVKPVGTDSIRDAKHPGVKAGLEQGLTTAGADPGTRQSRAAVRSTVQSVFQGDYDAVTHIESFFNFSVERNSSDGNKISKLTVIWKTTCVILLPANADAQVTSHEDGHKLIEEKTKDLANTRFTVVSAQILDQVLSDAQVSALLVPIKTTLEKIANDASTAYDAATNHGTEGGVDQSIPATDAFNTTAAANP